MIRAFALFLALAPQVALAQGWEVIGSSGTLKSSKTNDKLVISRDDSLGNVVLIVSPGAPDCRMVDESPVESLGSFAVNGRRVKMIGGCMHGNFSLLPQTKDGQAYILGEISRNADITIQYGTGNTDTFINKDGDRALLEIMESDKGI